jgi:hypothetical protein
MGGASTNTNGRDHNCIQNISPKNLEERDYLGDLGVDN